MNDWSLSEFLNHLRSVDIRLALDGDRLACSAPKGALTSDIKAELQQRKVEILSFLRSVTVADIAAAPPIVPVRKGTTRPLSFAQQRLWFLDRMEPGNPIYNVAGALRLRGALDRDALERSFSEIIDRHETLRTVFREREGMPEAVIVSAGVWHMTVVDLQTMAKSEREGEAIRLARIDVRRSYDLAQGPLVRATLYVLSEDESILLVGMHHIVSDGWSIGVLMRELSQLYPAFRAGQASPLPPLPIQYGDFADWHRRWLESGALGSQTPYWKEALAAPLPVLEFPLDYSRPPIQTSRGETLAFSIPAQLYDDIKEFSKREKVTQFTTLLAAYQIVLARHSGQDDIVVGTAVANRQRREVADLIGFFVNTIALRTSLSGNPTVREYLDRVRQTTLDAFARQDVPFDRLVEVLKPERSLDRSPIFQTMFVLQNWPLTELELPELIIKRLEIGSRVSRYDLSVDAIEYEGTLRLYFEFNTDLFDPASIQRLVEHYQLMLKAMLANPEQRIGDIPLLTDEESQQVLIQLNETVASYPETSCVHELIEAQAERTPNAEAVRFGDVALSYRELMQRANQLAHRLRAMGVGADTLVGICVERTHEMVIATLAVWKAGGAYVPLDPAYPTERLEYMADDADLVALITESAFENTIPGIRCQVIYVDRDREAIAAEPYTAPVTESQSRNLAYVIYTSGSTGKPKGVLLEHRSLVNFLCAMQREPGLSNTDSLLSVTTLSFDIAGLELYLPLITGARVVLVSREVAIDGVQLAHAIRDTKATIMQATPATWRLLLESGWRAGNGLTVLCGGEALSASLASSLLATGATVWNLYGPTETTVWSTVHRVRPDQTPTPIGRPISNTRLYVLDPNMQPVPINVAGELYIGGDGLARGYHKRPDLTADRFVEDPFPADTRTHLHSQARIEAGPARLYRTGDQVRYRADGTLEYLGRLDHQVKIRGFRIELGEIESILAMHDLVQQAIVVVREDISGDQRLVAYLIANSDISESGESVTNAALRLWLAEHLPQFMIPSAFVMLETFPLTPNGKVDRRALPSPEASGQMASVSFVSPQSGAERAVAEVWCEVLRIERAGTNDNFFDLGGHSLLVVQLQSKLRERFDREMSLMELFRRPTVGAIAEFLSDTESVQHIQSLNAPAAQ